MERLKSEYINILDGILKMCSQNTENTSDEIRKKIAIEFKNTWKEQDISNQVFVALNNKLVKDGYATILNDTLVITLEGILFYDSGGYSLQKKIRESDLLKTRLVNTILILGSIGAFGYFLLEFYKLLFVSH